MIYIHADTGKASYGYLAPLFRTSKTMRTKKTYFSNIRQFFHFYDTLKRRLVILKSPIRFK
ncbi:hypothetical Protein YC6258_02106 [Gynuella sunshinyii YC6258]|uniref:Uncharacterized protein n=1 Tax=Gynuella sunshinyii YC6258 TaxID=1445510 RepID=A0A0C5VHJ8_9GAMM|nr:hypothetical Protein YC6258_02106 [Gynuella sunshinyii YC6258]